MPRTAAPPSRDALRGKPKPKADLPQQQPVTDEELVQKPPAKWKRPLVMALSIAALIIALIAAYIFLLLGEPDEEQKLATAVPEQAITMPMSAVESPGETNLQSIADAFGQPVLCLYGSGLTMQKARVYDTAFGGGYARRATVSYSLADGSQLNVESIRPTTAAVLLAGSGYKLRSGALYALGGVNGAWMQNDDYVCVFGQSDTAVYAVTCPRGHDEELQTLLRQTAPVQPTQAEQ